MYWMGADSLAELSTRSSPIAKVKMSLEMAWALLMSPLLNDSRTFSMDWMSAMGMTFSPTDSFE
jgi:hypothetical protein